VLGQISLLQPYLSGTGTVLGIEELLADLVEFLVGLVTLQVVLELVAPREVLATDAAVEWLLTRMHAAVALQVRRASEVHVAKIADEGTLAGMQADVVTQPRLALELLRTKAS
jgi:hypothetical protein